MLAKIDECCKTLKDIADAVDIEIEIKAKLRDGRLEKRVIETGPHAGKEEIYSNGNVNRLLTNSWRHYKKCEENPVSYRVLGLIIVVPHAFLNTEEFLKAVAYTQKGPLN
ncbi:hypothetical protein GOV04_05255 [Candidatus Woesearchaeota archaeon]|nr:hypothetical protein [Candidatus Woesearchaeota archaeon]